MPAPVLETNLWTVNTFTDQPFAGSSAAVMMVDAFPSDIMCQKIAAEISLSETGFVKRLGVDHFHIRWFSTKTEIPLCGQCTLAAAHVLFQENYISGNRITFESMTGPLYVTQKNLDIVLDFPLMPIEKEEQFSVALLKDLFGLKSIVNAIIDSGRMIVELSDEDELRGLLLSPQDVILLSCKDLIFTAKGRVPYDFVSRLFAPRHGINEDPVTGSIHCVLADYWRKKLGKASFEAYQASPRGGRLGVAIVGHRVHLSGRAVTMSKGTWLVAPA